MTHVPTLWFIFYDGKLLLEKNATGSLTVPCALVAPIAPPCMQHSIGTQGEMPCIAYSIESLPENTALHPTALRDSYDLIDRALYFLAGKGAQMIHWDTFSQYCSVCGTKTVLGTPSSKHCPNCGQDIFPTLATAVLVLLCKGDSTLMVRAHNFNGPFYGLVAGFVEPGETLEQCVEREVYEETRLKVGNIRYFGCQPWPYPNGLMVGYVVDYLEGEIVLQKEELSVAEFFRYDAMPPLPHKLSLARHMVDWWLESKGVALLPE